MDIENKLSHLRDLGTIAFIYDGGKWHTNIKDEDWVDEEND